GPMYRANSSSRASRTTATSGHDESEACGSGTVRPPPPASSGDEAPGGGTRSDPGGSGTSAVKLTTIQPPGAHMRQCGCLTAPHSMWNRLRYSFWAPAYDAIANAAGFDAARRLSIARLGLASGDRLLIVGAGTGLDLPYIPPDVDVTAVDVTPA